MLQGTKQQRSVSTSQ